MSGRIILIKLFLPVCLVLCFCYLIVQNFSIVLGNNALPELMDPRLKVEELGKGLPDSISNIDFLDENKILALGKTSGEVYLISNGELQPRPVLKVNVNGTVERGLLGIAVDKNFELNNSGSKERTSYFFPDVYLYFTEIGNDTHPKNSIYKYEWNGTNLINRSLILQIPLIPGPHHNGGEMLIGPDGFLYITVGDYGNHGILQNIRNGSDPNDTGVILRINPNNSLTAGNYPNYSVYRGGSIDKYIGYGIRNSFGIAFDPLTGHLWETENGPELYDEINLVKPGFNGGWKSVYGPIARNNQSSLELVNLPGFHYSDPVFSWRIPIAVTGIDFMKSNLLGENYLNNIFVGGFNNGNLYGFKVNESRTGLDIGKNMTGLDDLVVDSKAEESKIIFGKGFGRITDVKSGPDGLLYVVDYGYGEMNGNPPTHRIFKILPK